MSLTEANVDCRIARGHRVFLPPVEMSQSLLVTSCPPVPGSPPQTTDEDSESSDLNKAAPSKPVSYPPSCQLTPPTPPSTNIVDSQLPKKDLMSENIQETQIVGRKRRQKLASFPSKFTRMDDEEDDVPEYRNSVEDSVCDYSPVRKTRRKSLRIRELSRLSCQTVDKMEEGSAKEFKIQQNPSEGDSRGGFDHYKQKEANPASPISSNNTQRDEISFSIGLGSTSAPLVAVKSQEKEEKYQTKAENDNARESAGSAIPLNAMTIPLKSELAMPNIKMPVSRQSNTPEEACRTSPHLARGDQSIGTCHRTTKPNVGQSAGFVLEGSTDRLQGHEFHRISADITRHFQSRLHNRQQSSYPTPAKQNAAYPNSLQHGRKPIMGPSTPHLHHLHHLQMPQDDETHVCIECNKVFKRSIYLQRHMAREHWTTAKLFKCDTCSYETKHQSNLLVHKRTHTGERPYFCGDCGQRYTQGHLLKAHIRSRHSSNMQLYNMEKRSPNEVLASQTLATSSTEGQNNCNKKALTVHPRDTVANRSGNEGLEKIQFLVDAASSFQNHKHFQHRNHSDKNLHGSLAKAFLRNEQATIDNKSAAHEMKEDLDYGNLKHHYHHYHHRSGFAKEQPAMQQKKGEARTSGRMTTHSNGEVIDLDTPEPPAEVEGPGDKSNSIQNAPVLNGSLSPGVCSSVDFKSNRRKFEETATPHSFLYSNGVNYPLEYFQPPTPSLNSSILFNTFLTSCLPNPYPLENRKSTLKQSSSQLHPPLNVSSSEGEDQYVDVDGDEEEDVKPLNLSTQKMVPSDNFARGNETEHRKTLLKQIPLEAYNQTFDPLNQFSAFASFHGQQKDEGVRSVIKSLNPKPIPSLSTPRADSVLGRDPTYERNPTMPLMKCRASTDIVENSNYGSNEATASNREWLKEEASIPAGSDSVASRSLEVEHPANGFRSPSPCPRDRCPDRLKLESLRRDVYRMLRVFMPYFVLDDVEGKTDALDNFLHEVLYSKLEG